MFYHKNAWSRQFCFFDIDFKINFDVKTSSIFFLTVPPIFLMILNKFARKFYWYRKQFARKLLSKNAKF